MYRSIVLFFLFSITISGYSQSKNIVECLELIDFNPEQYIVADIPLDRTDSIVDIKAGYFEISISQFEDEKLKLIQAAKFNNEDGTITLAITGYYADEQCSNHPFHFFEISKDGKSFLELETTTILPSLSLNSLLEKSTCFKVLSKYLPEIKKNYLGPNTKMEQVINEIYDYRIFLPKQGANIAISLTTCDYIPRNQVGFMEADWEAVESSIKTIIFAYNKELKRFERL